LFSYLPHCLLYPHSFPTRRSSDLVDEEAHDRIAPLLGRMVLDSRYSHGDPPPLIFAAGPAELDDGDDQHQYEQDHGDGAGIAVRSEEHMSELQSRFDLVCRLILET